MNLSSLGDSLRSRFNQLSVRLRPPAELLTQLREDAQAVQDSVKVSLKEQAERPTLYDRQAVVTSSPGRDTKLRALEKVSELKARVRMLKSRIAGASGPLLKRLARQLGQIAAELKQAVGLYTGASAREAGASAAGASLTGNANSSASASGAAASPAQAGGTGASANAAMTVGAAASISTEDSSAQAHAHASQHASADSAAEADSHASAEQAHSSQAARNEGEDPLDKLFAREVKTLLEEIKRAAALIRQKADKDSRNALSELDRVLAEIQNMLAQLNQSGQGQAAGSAVASVVASALSSVGALGGVSGVSADGGAAVGAVSEVGDVSVGSVTAAVSPSA